MLRERTIKKNQLNFEIEFSRMKYQISLCSTLKLFFPNPTRHYVANLLILRTSSSRSRSKENVPRENTGARAKVAEAIGRRVGIGANELEATGGKRVAGRGW